MKLSGSVPFFNCSADHAERQFLNGNEPFAAMRTARLLIGDQGGPDVDVLSVSRPSHGVFMCLCEVSPASEEPLQSWKELLSRHNLPGSCRSGRHAWLISHRRGMWRLPRRQRYQRTWGGGGGEYGKGAAAAPDQEERFGRLAPARDFHQVRSQGNFLLLARN
jgi:hypothetical protein